MTTEPRRRRGEEGFTLIEVLVAMVILAVGLLALEALGIGAARSVTLAEEQSEMAMLATRVMEDRMLEVRTDPATVSTTESCASEPGSGYHVCSQVLTRGQLPSLSSGAARVAVSVREAPEAPVLYDLVSHVYDSRLP